MPRRVCRARQEAESRGWDVEGYSMHFKGLMIYLSAVCDQDTDLSPSCLE